MEGVVRLKRKTRGFGTLWQTALVAWRYPEISAGVTTDIGVDVLPPAWAIMNNGTWGPSKGPPETMGKTSYYPSEPIKNPDFAVTSPTGG